MKKVLFVGLLISTLLSCRTIEETVVFENKRTPLNPIAHQGYKFYKLELVHSYRKNYKQNLAEYQQEVEQLTIEYNEKMDEYNSYTRQEIEENLIKRPVLLLPDEPTPPHEIEDEEFLKNIIIEGLSKGENNAIGIAIFLNGFEWKNPSKRVHTKKNDDESVDTTFSYSASIRHTVETNISTPEGESDHSTVGETFRWGTVSGAQDQDTTKAYNNLLSVLEVQEKSFSRRISNQVNDFLNSELGTLDVRYKVTLFSFKSNNRKDYSDIDQGVRNAKEGLLTLNTDKNKGIELLNEAIIRWDQAANEYRQNLDGRIDDKEMKAILLNLIVAATFTQNWEAGKNWINEFESMKLRNKDKRNLNQVKNNYYDLKSRYRVAG